MSTTAQSEPARQPDIVVIYLDDVDPHDARLWKNPKRTPTLSSMFAKAGVQFTSAVSETPLCSPGRAATLTGQHTLNHGVAENVAAPFDPRVTIATELRRSGYQTIFVGKYLNQLRDEVKPRQLKRYAKGWDDVRHHLREQRQVLRLHDVVARRAGAGSTAVGKSDHSTLVTKRKLVKEHQGSTGRPAALRLRQHLRPAPAQPARAEVRERQELPQDQGLDPAQLRRQRQGQAQVRAPAQQALESLVGHQDADLLRGDAGRWRS